MASLHKEIVVLFLTLAFFLVQISQIVADLAPNEDEDEIVKPDIKKTDDTITTLEPPKIASNLGEFSVIYCDEAANW